MDEKINRGYEELAISIVKRACFDYQLYQKRLPLLLRRQQKVAARKCKEQMEELIDWFYSPYIEFMIGVTGESILLRVQEELEGGGALWKDR